MQTVNDILRDAFNKIKDEHGLVLHKVVFENGEIGLSGNVTGTQWVRISKHQIKDVKVGDAIRVNGTVTRLKKHYAPSDHGFDTKGYIKYPVGYASDTYADEWWEDGITVEVLR